MYIKSSMAAPLEHALSVLGSSPDALSANKIQAAADAGLAYHREYKTVVHLVERFVRKQEPEKRLAGIYVIDAICRKSKKEDVDPFGPRFAKNLAETLR